MLKWFPDNDKGYKPQRRKVRKERQKAATKMRIKDKKRQKRLEIEKQTKNL